MPSQDDGGSGDSPGENRPPGINLAREKIGWRKYRPLLATLGWGVRIALLAVISIPFLPIIIPMFFFETYQKHRRKKAVESGVLTSELAVSLLTTVYLSVRDVYGILGAIDMEYSRNTTQASFHHGQGNQRYRVYGTSEEGLFLLVPRQSKIKADKIDKDFFFRCEVVRVRGGYNHGDFGETAPMGSEDCLVLIARKVVKFAPSKDLLVLSQCE